MNPTSYGAHNFVTAPITIRQGKAYLPTVAITEYELYLHVEPVYVVDANVDALLEVVEFLIASGHRPIPEPSYTELAELSKIMLKAANVSSGDELLIDEREYDIQRLRYNDKLVVNYKLAFPTILGGPTKRQEFPDNTPLRTLIEFILEDAAKYPNVVKYLLNLSHQYINNRLYFSTSYAIIAALVL